MNALPLMLTGRYVRLEPLRLDQVEALCRFGLAPELWAATTIRVRTVVEMRDYVQRALELQAAGSAVPFVIVHQPSETIVGATRFHSLAPEHRKMEIGYTFIDPRWQRTAVNTETKLLMLRHAFETWQCVRVQFTANATNEKSRAALRRIGAVEEAVFRQHRVSAHLGPCDVAIYSIIAPEWSAVQLRLEARLRAG